MASGRVFFFGSYEWAVLLHSSLFFPLLRLNIDERLSRSKEAATFRSSFHLRSRERKVFHFVPLKQSGCECASDPPTSRESIVLPVFFFFFPLMAVHSIPFF